MSGTMLGSFGDLMREAFKKLDERKHMGYSKAVSVGGRKKHIKKTGEYAALCGYEPKSPKGKEFIRGKWNLVQPIGELPPEVSGWCLTCRRKYLAARLLQAASRKPPFGD